jgi:hypothetical protein
MSNNLNELVQTQQNVQSDEELIFQKLIQKNPTIYKSPSGEIYQVYLVEENSFGQTFHSIYQNYGKGNTYDADVDYQRLKDQHKLESKRKILHDILMGERVGRIVLYRKPGTIDMYEVVDGKQRIEIMRDFIQNKLKLTDKYAASFWARYYTYLNNNSIDSIKANKIKRSLIKDKSVPDVKFESLPMKLQNKILDTTFEIAKIREVEFRNIKTDKTIQIGHPDYSQELARKCIEKKFGKINSQVAVSKPEDTIYGQTSEIVIESRKFVRSSHPLLSMLNIEIQDRSVDTKSQREFAFQIIKCLIMFEKNKNEKYLIDWAPKSKTIQDLILDGKVDELSEDNQKFLEFLKFTIGKVLSKPFLIDGKEFFIKVPSEFLGSGKKIIHLTLLCSLKMTYDKIVTDKEFMKKYFSDGGPNNRFFIYIQHLFNFLSLLSLASKKDLKLSLDSPDSPVKKYNLQDDYFDTENFEIIENVILLNRNNGNLGRNFREKLSKLINLINSKL